MLKFTFMKKITFIYILCSCIISVFSGCGLYAQECFPKEKLLSHITALTDFGERPEWSNDGKMVYFIDKAGGDLWSVDIRTGKTSRITNPDDRPRGHGFYRIACLVNGDLLLCCGAERHRLYFQVLDKSFKKPPVTIEGGGWDDGGEGCDEGPAVSRKSMKIAWTTPGQLQIYSGDISYKNGKPAIINKKLLVDYRDIVTVDDEKFGTAIESQDWRPPKEEELIFSQYNTIWRIVERNKPTAVAPDQRKNAAMESNPEIDNNSGGCEVLGININTGRIINYSKAPDIYDEPEGIFPDGKYTLVECNKHQPQGKTGTIDIYKLKLDGSGDSKRLTFFADEKGYRASNPVVNRSGNMIAFSGSRANMDAGQGCGLFLFDLKKFEKTEKSRK